MNRIRNAAHAESGNPPPLDQTGAGEFSQEQQHRLPPGTKEAFAAAKLVFRYTATSAAIIGQRAAALERQVALAAMFEIYHRHLPAEGCSGNALARGYATQWLAGVLDQFGLSENERQSVRSELMRRIRDRDPQREVRLVLIDVLHCAHLQASAADRLEAAMLLENECLAEHDCEVARRMKWCADALR